MKYVRRAATASIPVTCHGLAQRMWPQVSGNSVCIAAERDSPRHYPLALFEPDDEQPAGAGSQESRVRPSQLPKNRPCCIGRSAPPREELIANSTDGAFNLPPGPDC